MGKILKNYKTILIVLLVVILAIGAWAILDLTKPYAVYADGTKVENPYAVTADGEELVVVEDQETAEQVVETVMNEYTPEGAQIDSITVDKQLSSDKKSLKRNEDPETVLTADEAVDYIIEQNDSDDPLFSVTVDAEIGSVESVKAGTSYEKNDEIFEGETELKSKGVDGDEIVTNEVTSVNGKVLNEEVIDEAVINEGENKVVYQGTKDKDIKALSNTGTGEIMGTGDGSIVSSYALNFVGNPYVYGGTSLTNGADCSGFVQSVYAKFGISLPRTANAQAAYGKSVSYSNAQPGDLIFYPGHVAIYIGGGKIVHAANSRQGIRVSSATYNSIRSVKRIVE